MHVPQIDIGDLRIEHAEITDPVDDKVVKKLRRWSINVVWRSDPPGTQRMQGEIILPLELIDDLAGDFDTALGQAIRERVQLDLDEMNRTGPFAGYPMDEAVHDMRMVMGLETVL